MNFSDPEYRRMNSHELTEECLLYRQAPSFRVLGICWPPLVMVSNAAHGMVWLGHCEGVDAVGASLD